MFQIGKDDPKTDLRLADDFALLSAEHLVKAWKQTDNSDYLLQAAIILHYAIRQSPYKNQIRISLVRILRLLGLPSSALEAFLALNIRAVQYDTVAHFTSERSSSFLLAHADYITIS